MFSSVRIAIRSLVRRPAVVAVAVLSLAVGIGVNCTVFSIVDAMFLRPPAVTDPDGLVEIAGNFRDSGNAVLDWADCREIAGQTSAFSAVSGSMRRGGLWRNGNEMTRLLVDMVGDNYFEMLGVRPILGRLPDSKYDYAADSEPPIVLAYWLWRERMGGRPDVIGQRVEFRDQVWRIAAVLPQQFRGLRSMDQAHVWIPASGWTRYFRRDLERGSGQFLTVARLRSGVSLEQAQAQLNLVAKRIEAGDSHVKKGRRLVATSIAREMRSHLRPGMLVMGVVALVLLIACANVAAVLLAQAEARRREIGLRLSLGAGWQALVRQFLAESTLLAIAGAALGLLLASWLLGLAPAFAPPSSVPLKFDFRMDVRLLLFTAACGLVTLVICGLAPLAYALRVSLIDAISGSRSMGRTPRAFLRNTLVTAQIALSVVLAGGAVVLTHALGDAQEIYPGYDSSRQLALVNANSGSSKTGKSDHLLFSEAAARMATVSGVEAVTYARHLPLIESGGGATLSVTPEGAPADAPPRNVYFNLIGPRFFEVTGARMTAGRDFTDAEHNGRAPVAIINAEAARRFWPAQNPLGKLLRISKQAYEVVGVATDGRIGSLYESPVPAIYLPAVRMNWGETILIARTKGDAALIAKDVAKAAAQIPGLRIYESTTLRTVMKQALYTDWIPSVLGGFLAIIGLLLAAGGLYGAISYATGRRLGEFGVRMAVGAKAAHIAALVLRQAAFFSVVGVAAGAVLFISLYHYYGTTLFRGRPLDLFAIAIGAIITMAAVLAGTLLPAMRAARLDPLEVLRTE